LNIDNLLTAEDLAKGLKNRITVERIEELAESELIPHIRFEGKRLFHLPTAKKWIGENLTVEIPGAPLGTKLLTVNIMLTNEPMKHIPPLAIRPLSRHLVPIAAFSHESPAVSGVYFLCHNDEVVYIGQSVNVFSRVGSHAGQKTFSYAFFVPVAKSDLTFVELSLIQALKPKYNKTSFNGPCGKDMKLRSNDASIIVSTIVKETSE
jgi:hypothetical protein